jgi:hypothetical protein
MHLDPWLMLRLIIALLAAQAGLWFLARLLQVSLRREVVAAGLLLPWLVLWPWVAGNRLLAPTEALAGQVPGTLAQGPMKGHALELSDEMFQFLPWELEVRHAFSEGRWPFWSDRIDGGSSPWANPSVAVLSPIAVAARLLPIQHCFLAALALKILVALQGAWLLARRLGMRRWTALAVGGCFSLSGAIMAWAIFPHSATAAWTPWCLAGALAVARPRGGRVFRLRARRAALLATSFAFAALLLSGQQEVAAGAGGLSVIVALALARRHRWRALVRLVVAATLGAGLSAPLVLPFLVLLPKSQRAGEHLTRVAAAENPAGGESDRPWFAEGKGKLLLAPVSPVVFGRPYEPGVPSATLWTISVSAYAGMAAFLGCAMVLVSRRRRWAAPFLGFAAVSMLLAYDFQPLVRWWFAFPPFRLPEYARFLPVAVLGMAMAGGMGLEALGRRRRWPLLAAGAAACALSVAVAPRLEIAAPWVLLAAAALAPRRGVRGMLLGAAVLVEMVPWARWMLPSGDPSLFFPRTAEVETLRREVGAEYRAMGQDLLAYPAVLPFYGVGDPRAHNPLLPNDYLTVLRTAFGFSPTTVEYYSPVRWVNHPLRRYLGVKLLVSNLYLPPPPGAQPLPAEPGSATRLYRDSEALPRIFTAIAADQIPRKEIEPWLEAMTDPRRVAVYREEIGDWSLPPRLRVGEVRLDRFERGEIELWVPPLGAKLLATSIPGPDGWSARSGGKALRMLTINGAFLGVVVPQRVSSVTLTYRPPGLRAGLAIALLSLGGLLLVAWAPPFWVRPRALRDGTLAAVAIAASLTLAMQARSQIARRAAPRSAHAKVPHLWAWGTPPPESVRSLVLAADPLLPPAKCRVGFASSWSGEDELFPPLWAAYFLPRCDVVPARDPATAGVTWLLVHGEGAVPDGWTRVATLPGGALYRMPE